MFETLLLEEKISELDSTDDVTASLERPDLTQATPLQPNSFS